MEYEGGIETESKSHTATATSTINSMSVGAPTNTISYSPSVITQSSLNNHIYNLIRLNGNNNIFTFEYEQDETKITHTETSYNVSWDFDKAMPVSIISSLNYFGKSTNGNVKSFSTTASTKKNTVTVNVSNYSSDLYSCTTFPEANTIPEGQEFT